MTASWKTIKIQDLIRLGEAELRTGPFDTQLHASDYVETGTAVINVRNLGFGDIRQEKLEYISDGTVARLPSHLLQPQDIVFGRKGAVERHAFIRDKQSSWFQGSDCLRLRLKGSFVEPQFVSYHCLTENHKTWMIGRCGHGATMASLNQDIVGRIELRVPPLSIQRRIVSILSAYDDLIENNTRRIQILEEIAQALYREWFVDFRFPGHEQSRMVESELGLIPQGWEVKRLSELAQLVMGQSPSSTFYNLKGEGLPFHQGVADFGGRFPADRVYTTAKNRIAEAGDILFSVRAPVGRINLSTKKIVIGRGLSAIRSKSGDQCFLFQQLKDKFQEEDSMGNGAIFKAVTKDDMHGISLPSPTQALTSQFESILRPMFRELEVLNSKNLNLRQTRDLLLPRLISGEVDVSELDITTEGAAAA